MWNVVYIQNMIFPPYRNNPSGPGLPHCPGFTISLRHTHTAAGRTPLDEWSARRIDLYLTAHNTHKRQTSMPPRRHSNPQSQQARVTQTQTLDRAATGIGGHYKYTYKSCNKCIYFLNHKENRNVVSAVGKATRLQAGLGFESWLGRELLCSSSDRPNRPWGPPSLLSKGYRGLFSAGRAAAPWSWQLSYSTEVKNEWSYTSTPYMPSLRGQGQVYLLWQIKIADRKSAGRINNT